MPRKKEIKLDDTLKAIGVQDVKQNGSQVSLYIDPSKTTPNVRKSIANGLSRNAAQAATLWNQPQYPTFFEGNKDIANLRPHDKMRIAMSYFNTDPLVGKIIELMKVFANDGFKNEHADPKIKAFYDNWCTTVDFELVLGWIFLEYFRSGNATTARELIPVTKAVNIGKIAPGPYAVDGAAKNRFTKRMIPAAYTVLNPLTVYVTELNGYKDSLMLSSQGLDIEPTSSSDLAKLKVDGIPQGMVDMRRFKDGIPLDEKNVRRILRMRQPYEAYGSILMERAFGALYEKNKLRQMDMSMVNSVINQIVKVTIGNDQFPATPKAIKNVAEAFQNVGKSQTIFWNHTLQIEVIRPDISVLKNDKYERVNEDIRNAFGISEILTGGGSSGANFATSYLSLKTFLSNLMDARKDVLRWVRQEYADIAEAMGFDSYPEPSFNPLSMTDEIAEKQIIMQLVDRGIISYQTAQSRLGYDPQIEVDRRTEEKPLMEEGILGFLGSPFQQEANKEAVDTKEESNEKIAVDDKKNVDKRDQKENQRERKNSQNKNPSARVPDKGRPGKGLDGRPPTKTGKKMPDRKTAKIKGQGEQLDLVTAELTPAKAVSIVEEYLAKTK